MNVSNGEKFVEPAYQILKDTQLVAINSCSSSMGLGDVVQRRNANWSSSDITKRQ